MNSRAGVVLAAAVGLLVLLAVVAGIVSSTRDREELPAGSPEAVVQDYVELVYADDLDAALALLEPGTTCTVTDLSGAHVRPDGRVLLRDTRVNGDRATVELSFVRGSDGPFESEWTIDETFRLTRTGGEWRISDVPWPMVECRRQP